MYVHVCRIQSMAALVALVAGCRDDHAVELTVVVGVEPTSALHTRRVCRALIARTQAKYIRRTCAKGIVPDIVLADEVGG